MGLPFLTHCVLVTLIPIVISQNPTGNSPRQNEQGRLRCLGVRCPADRPRCVTESQVTKCVPLEPIRIISSRDRQNNRLSRPAPGFGSPRNQPSRTSQTFQLNESEKSHRNMKEVSSIPSSNPTTVEQEGNSGNVPSYCFERSQTGRCRAYFPRYFYNKDTGRCQRFVFGGCGGNKNNFKTEQDCKRNCLVPVMNNGFNVGLEATNPNPGNVNVPQNRPGSDVNTENYPSRPTQVNSGFAKGAPPPQPMYCQQNPERGPCFAQVPRYYYNKQTGQCRSFLFGGCGGNRNNFQSLSSCKRACDYFDFYTARQNNGKNIAQGAKADILPSEIPTERLNQRLAPSPSQSSLNPFINNRESQRTSGFAKGAPPPMPERCFQTPERGPCFAYMPRFYYNKEVGQCRSFAYGGCGGNRNNFQSMTACKRVCDYIDSYTSRQSNGNNIKQDQAADVVLSTDIPEISFIPTPTVPSTTLNPLPKFCLLPKKVGPCRALIPRFFYNSETSRCEQFGFGGCQPNENNFKSERECKRQCIVPAKFNRLKQVPRVRNISPERNNVARGQLRQFNPVDSTAFREFLMSQQMNNDIQMVEPSVASGFHMCTQRLDSGTCNLKIRSYFFNAETRSCQPFIFHGCGGNQNRFSSLRACEDMCINDTMRPARVP